MTRTISRKGADMAKELRGYYPDSAALEVAEILSVISRHAATHQWYATQDCNRGLEHNELAATYQLEVAIKALVDELATHFYKPVTVRFTGDPRGYTVKLMIAEHPGNTWGGASEGYGVVA